MLMDVQQQGVAAVASVTAPLPRAILMTLHYADLFDYPLTLPELARYLIGYQAAAAAEIAEALTQHPTLRAAVEQAEGYYYLAGREALVGVRQERARVSAALWRRARRYGRLIAHWPFVRMVAVTGALAMDNVGQRVDIDLLIAAAPGRVWICRRFLIGLVRLVRLAGDELCPNYIVDTRHLPMTQQDLYTAHELVQMVPLAGYPLYSQMLAANAWANAYLPNAVPRPAPATVRRPLGRVLQRGAELPLRLPPLATWERWELRRMQDHLAVTRQSTPEIIFSPTQCKGHLGAYRATVLERFAQRIEA